MIFIKRPPAPLNSRNVREEDMTKKFTAFSSLAAPVMESNETNVTVIYKTNSHWPVRGMMSVDPCELRQCQEI